MTKIEHIIGTGHELAESQRRVWMVLTKHPDHVFRMYGDDLDELARWATDPDLPEPPAVLGAGPHVYSINTIKWCLNTLHEQGKITSYEHRRRTYYGSFAAIEYMKTAASVKAAEKKAKGTGPGADADEPDIPPERYRQAVEAAKGALRKVAKSPPPNHRPPNVYREVSQAVGPIIEVAGQTFPNPRAPVMLFSKVLQQAVKELQEESGAEGQEALRSDQTGNADGKARA